MGYYVLNDFIYLRGRMHHLVLNFMIRFCYQMVAQVM